MAFIPKTWVDDQIVYAADMNRIEQGIAETDALLRERANPNLLDNWYFGNPVNQRGQTVYTGLAGGGLVYSIDRYGVYGRGSSGVTLSIEDGFIRVTPNAEYQGIRWGVESKSIAGKKCTFSVLLKANGRMGLECRNNGYDGSVIYSETFDCTSDTWNLLVVPFDVPSNSTSLNFAILSPDTVIFDALAVKLELGDQQTLAHQENGNWVLNEIPNYAEELAKCKRYYQVLPSFSTYGVCQWSTSFEFIVSLPVEMRTVPAATFPSNLTNTIRELGNKNLTPSQIRMLDHPYSTSKSIYIVVNGSELSIGKAYSIDANIPLSADL